MPHGAIRFPFGKCRVCQDQATGVHYGVATCEGCKGFFKRSTIRGEKYKCFFGGQCEITPQNRNRCKSCRFRLCLESGMSLEAVKMGRIPKLEKERALELASQEGKQRDIVTKKVEGQKKGVTKASGSLEGHQTMDLLPSPPQQLKLASLFDNAQQTSTSLHNSDSTPINSEMYFDAGKPRMIEPRQSISSADSSTDSQSSSDYLGQGFHSPEGSTPWGPQPLGPPSSLASSHSVSSFTPSFFSESCGLGQMDSMPDTTGSTKIKTEFSPPQTEDCLQRNPSTSASLSSPQMPEGGPSPKRCEAVSLHTDSFFSYVDQHSDGEKEGYHRSYSSSMDYDTDFSEKVFASSEASSNSFHHYRSNSCEQYGASRSNDSTIWDKEILVKLQLNDDSFKTEVRTSDVYAPVRNHYSFLCDVEQGGMFNRLPLYIQTLQQLDVCQRTGLLLKLQEMPTDMIDKICKMLAMEDRYAVSKEGVSMGKDSTFLIQGTLQRLKYSMDVLWKPIWLMRQYIRQQLANPPGTMDHTGDTDEDMMKVWPSLMKSVPFYNDVILGFAFGCPGFKNLQNELKEYLTQRAYFDIWILLMSDFCIDGTCHFPLPSRQIYTNGTMMKILKEKTFLEIRSVLERINKCQLCDLEIGLLCAILLIDADDEKLTGNTEMNLEPLRALHSHYLDILATVVSKIHTTQSTKRLRDIFSLTPLIKKLSTRLQVQVPQYAIEQIPDEDSLQSIAMNAQACVEKEHLL